MSEAVVGDREIGCRCSIRWKGYGGVEARLTSRCECVRIASSGVVVVERVVGGSEADLRCEVAAAAGCKRRATWGKKGGGCSGVKLDRLCWPTFRD